MNYRTRSVRRWLLLVASLPTANATVRMRLWRAIKGLGCAVLRDGAYLLPHSVEHARTFRSLAAETLGANGTAHLLEISAGDAGQRREFEQMFDRTKDYARLLADLRGFRAGGSARRHAVIRRRLNALRRGFEAISATDYFPGPARLQAAQALSEAEAAVAAVLSPGEPHAVTSAIRRLDRSKYRKRHWATRKHPWVDRLVSAWLIRRFIDPQARFLWLNRPSDCPGNALGFDFDGATFTHIGARVTFEVLIASFGLDDDPALVRLASIVHYLDVGGIPAPEAGGLEALLRGARLCCRTDGALLKEASIAFDRLYTAFSNEARRSPQSRSAQAGRTRPARKQT